MRYGIFSDIHGNLEAFKEVIKAYKKEGIDEYICVGDIVGYGADPCWCIEEVRRLNITAVCGNHDWATAGLFNADYFNYAARAAVKWTQENLGAREKEFLKSLELVLDEEDFSVVHSSLDRPDFFSYITNAESAYKCFQRMEKAICFIGHSHVAETFFIENNKISHSFEGHINIRPRVKYIVNVGSIGQPRDGNPKAAFSIFDSDKMTIEMKRVSYDVESAKNKILDAGLPEILGYRLLKGQ